jgi:HlyD family secretion protein
MDIKKKKRAWFSGKRRLSILLGATALIIVVGIGFGVGGAAPSAKRSDLWIDSARHGDMVREIRATGTLVPKVNRWITAGVAGTVQELVVQAGERVEADTVLIRLSNPAAKTESERAKAALAGAQADVAAKRAALDLQRLEQNALLAKAESALRITEAKTAALTRAEAAGVVSRLELNQSQITMEQDRSLAGAERDRVAAMGRNVEAQMRAVTAARDEAETAYEIAQREEQQLEVRAGIEGIVQEVSAELGEQVELGQRLARVAKHDVLIARLQVPEVQANDLVLDLPVRIEMNGGALSGRIARIDPAVREGRVVIDVAFDAPPPAGARPDLTVEGRIVLDELAGVMSIARPTGALPGGAGSLFVLSNGSNIAQRRSVRYGSASSDRIEIKAGLAEGDQVILSDTGQWNTYDSIRVE